MEYNNRWRRSRAIRLPGSDCAGSGCGGEAATAPERRLRDQNGNDNPGVPNHA